MANSTNSSTVSPLFNFGIRSDNTTIRDLKLQGASCAYCTNRNRNKYCSVKKKHTADYNICEFHNKEVIK